MENSDNQRDEKKEHCFFGTDMTMDRPPLLDDRVLAKMIYSRIISVKVVRYGE